MRAEKSAVFTAQSVMPIRFRQHSIQEEHGIEL